MHAQQAKPYEGVDPGQPVAIDLRSGARILTALPFDVQFYFQSPIGEDVTKVTGRYVGSKKPQFCSELYPDAAPAQNAYLQGFDPEAATSPPPVPPPALTPIQLRLVNRDNIGLRAVKLAPTSAEAHAEPLRQLESS